MTKLVRLILNIVALAIYIVAFVGFFLKYIYGWILGIGIVGTYEGYELALNFEGFPENLGTLFPLLAVLGSIIYLIIMVIKLIKSLKKEPKESKGGMIKPLLISIFFVLVPLICLFLTLATVSILNLPKPKNYGGYYMGEGPYMVAYSMIIGGLLVFIANSGIFKEKVKEAKSTEGEVRPAKTGSKIEEAKPVVAEQPKPVSKVETKPTPKAEAKPKETKLTPKAIKK